MPVPLVPTLQNFGVPNGDGTPRTTMLMPKVKNRFRVTVQSFGQSNSSVLFTQQVISVARPNINFNPVKVDSYNSIAWYAGKAEWETVTITLRDDITNNASTLIGSQMQRQMNFFEQTVVASASSYKFGMQIDTLDGGNDVNGSGTLETWVFEGCMLATVNYESFDYASADAMTIECTIRFDNVTEAGGVVMPYSPTFTNPDITAASNAPIATG
jgi:hypothetical protein